MDHKAIIIESRCEWERPPFFEQWALLRLYQAGIEWDHEEIDHNFAQSSRRLLNRVKRLRS